MPRGKSELSKAIADSKNVPLLERRNRRAVYELGFGLVVAGGFYALHAEQEHSLSPSAFGLETGQIGMYISLGAIGLRAAMAAMADRRLARVETLPELVNAEIERIAKDFQSVAAKDTAAASLIEADTSFTELCAPLASPPEDLG